jgi:hypothetical protein
VHSSAQADVLEVFMPRSRLLALTLLLATPCFASAPTWVEVHSKNFNVLTDAGEKRGQEVARRFEEVRAAYGAIFQKMNVNSPVPLQIIAFRNNKELKQYGPVWKGKAVEVDGFFQGSKDKNFVALDLSSEGGWHVVFHEYMHLLINTNMPPTPAWFDEGFADYFSTLTVNGKTIEFGNIPEGYPELLSQSRWMKTLDLFSVQHNSSEYNEGDRRSLFYAQSWLTIHYVMTQRKLPEATKYLDLTINQHRGVEEALQMAFGMTPLQFDKALRDYFTSRRQPIPSSSKQAWRTCTFMRSITCRREWRSSRRLQPKTRITSSLSVDSDMPTCRRTISNTPRNISSAQQLPIPLTPKFTI